MKDSNRINEFRENFPNLIHFLQLQETENLSEKYPGIWRLSLPYIRIMEEALSILQQNPQVLNSQRIESWQSDLEGVDVDHVLPIITEMEIAKELVKHGATVYFEEPVYKTGKNLDLKVKCDGKYFFIEVKTRRYIESEGMKWKKIITDDLEQEIKKLTGKPVSVNFIEYSYLDFIPFRTLRKDFVKELGQAVCRDFSQKAPNVYCQRLSKDCLVYCIRYTMSIQEGKLNIARLDRKCGECGIANCEKEALFCPVNKTYKYIEVWLNYPIRDEGVFYSRPPLEIPSQENGQNERTYLDKALEKFEKKLPDGQRIFCLDVASKYQPLIGYFNYVVHDDGIFFLDLDSDDYPDTVREAIKYYETIFTRECKYQYISGILIAYTIDLEDKRFKKVFVYNKRAKKAISADIVRKFIKPDHIINCNL